MARNEREEPSSAGKTGLGLLVLGFSSALFGALVIGPSLGERLQPHGKDGGKSGEERRVSQASLPIVTNPPATRAERPADQEEPEREPAAAPVKSSGNTEQPAVPSRTPEEAAQRENPDMDDGKPVAAAHPVTRDAEPARTRTRDRVASTAPDSEDATPAVRTHSTRRTDDTAVDEKPRHTRRTDDETPDEKPRHARRTDESAADEKPRHARRSDDSDDQPRAGRRSDDAPEKPHTRKVKVAARDAEVDAEPVKEKTRPTRERHPRAAEAEPPVKVAEKPHAAKEATPAAAAGDEDLTVYRVRVGRYKNREEADKAREEVAAAGGAEASIVHIGETYRLQLGAYRRKVNAEKIAEALRGKNYRPDVTEGKRAPTPAEPKASE